MLFCLLTKQVVYFLLNSPGYVINLFMRTLSLDRYADYIPLRQERLHSIKKYKQNTIIKKVCQCGSVTTTHTHTHSAHIHRLCLFISEMLSMCGMHAVMLNELCHRKEIIIQQHKKQLTDKPKNLCVHAPIHYMHDIHWT